MKIELVTMDGYDARLLKTDKYNVYTASFMFQLEYTRYNAFLIRILKKYLIYTNYKYKTREKINEALRENYGMNMFISSFDKGDKLFVELGLNLIDPQKLNEEYLDSALSLAHDLFFNINKTNGQKLNRRALKMLKEKEINNVGSYLSDPSYKEYVLFEKRVYKDSRYMIEHIDSKSEYEKILNSYSDKEIIDMHSHLINDCFVGCNLMGNYRKKDLDLIYKYFPFKYHTPVKDYKYYVNLDKVPSYIEYSNNKISTSYLTVVYKIEDYKSSEREKYFAINAALNSVGMLLHKVLREENKLVYTAYSNFLGATLGIYEVKAEISKENEQKTIDAIDEVFKRLKDKNVVKDILAKGKREVKLSNYIEDEVYSKVFNRMIDEHYKFCDLKKNITDKYMSLTAKDIVSAVSRIKKVTVFIYRGDKK